MGKLTPEKAEIIGLLCAEGCHFKYSSTFFRDRKRIAKRTQIKDYVDFTNLDKNLLQHFRNLLILVYDYAPKVTGVPTSLKIHILKKTVVKDLLSFTDFGFDKWRVPDKVMKSNKKIQASFIRGLYEGDGIKLQRAYKNCYYIGFHMKNKEGLKQLQALLENIGIGTRFWRDGYKKETTKLIIYGISDVFKFKNIIKPKFKQITIAESSRR